MPPTAPIWVIPPYGVDVFEPYPDGPTIVRAGTYITSQPTLDAVVAAAASAHLQLRFSNNPAPDPIPPDHPVTPFIRYDQVQTLSPAEQAQAQENMGGPFGGGSGGTGLTDNMDGTWTDTGGLFTDNGDGTWTG